MIKEINETFLADTDQELSQELTGKLSELEGVQEDRMDVVSVMEDALYEVNRQHKALAESLMLDKVMQVLLRTQKLLSSSIFINLEDTSTEEKAVDELKIEEEAKMLEEELTVLFADADRLVVRAVIANTLNKMPVFFADHKEVMDYVLYSLKRCSDLYEKTACYEIINAIMSE
jgi:hypothetical protein